MDLSKLLFKKGIIKNLKMLTQSQYSGIKFLATLCNAKQLISSLKAINFDETAIFQATDKGLRIIVESGKSIQANFYITKECFSEFRIPPEEEVFFSVNFNVVSDCLSISTGTDCSIRMIYKGDGAPLMLIMEHHEEDNVIIECSIKTKHYDEPLEYMIVEDSPSFNCVIIRGQDLSNLFNEIDKSAQDLEITLSPNAPYFRISTIGVMECITEIAKTSDMFSSFTCKTTTSMKYRLSHINHTVKALALASKVAIRTDCAGLLGLQLMILSEEAEQIYIEFFITPLVDYD